MELKISNQEGIVMEMCKLIAQKLGKSWNSKRVRYCYEVGLWKAISILDEQISFYSCNRRVQFWNGRLCVDLSLEEAF